ncbi:MULTISPECIES: NADH-quinone oxidoreductase subunit J [Rhodohalobacter]|jgi:NADH:ubiquinone oxidoreductase subunit 6 (subunit J)|uniref:NADH-quinone oxidoreductase subunit J n=1 Tax=Rhodohalobacter barkolensis TaxID=2053187 RepID=A0A2N0VLB3_9BACT|nr:NADH-quinone oxidoreductase subunit J [Rhodohalobacter barkolensis]PKD44976.1 NADH-quinone oxidoreductase subunit J [Rhodohalobacter barkolensis]
MELTAILFYLFSLVTIGSASVMVFSKNVVHSAFALMFTLIGVAALYALLYADFLAATQLLVYVGGILILILFGLMLTGQGHTVSFKSVTVNMVPATVLSIAAGVLLIYAFVTTGWNVIEPIERDETVYEMGMMLMGSYILPFIVIGVLLLIAIIGAILMSTRISTENTN